MKGSQNSIFRSIQNSPIPSGQVVITLAVTGFCRPTQLLCSEYNGHVMTTDGPYVETKEQLGGYYLIEARDLNEAIQVASRIPGAKIVCVEVRPVAEDKRTLEALGFI